MIRGSALATNLNVKNMEKTTCPTLVDSLRPHLIQLEYDLKLIQLLRLMGTQQLQVSGCPGPLAELPQVRYWGQLVSVPM